MTRSVHPGMGSTPYEGGVAFRTWAPFAAAVAVAGDFNGWNDVAHPLDPEGDGYWSADVPGAGPGQQYRYVLTTPGGERGWRIDPRARAVTSSIGNAVVYAAGAFDWGDDDFHAPPWNELVIYEMHVGTFNDPPGGGRGSLQSAAERLGYLRDLGINAVELMPVVEFAGPSSKGYNPALPFTVEADHGGPDALKDFVRRAHAHGIAVILDVTYNHFGYSDLDHSLWRYDGWSESDGGGIYFYNDWRMHTTWAAPRPDYGRAEVRQYIIDNALMWLQEFRVDGLRLDQTAEISSASGQPLVEGWQLLRDLNDTIDFAQPWKIVIAEDFRGGAVVTRSTQHGGGGFDAQWDSFAHDVRAAVVTPWDDDRDIARVAGAVARGYDGGHPRVIFSESHDENGNGRRRLPEEITPGDADSYHAKKRSTLAAVLVLTAPGIPMLFQGQEFLEDRWWADDVTLDWSKADTHAGIRLLYRDLVRLRRNWFDTTRGLRGPGIHVHHVSQDDKMLAFHRWEAGGPRDDVVVVANFSSYNHAHYRIGLPRAGPWCVRANSDWTGYDPNFGDWLGYDTHTDEISWDNMPVSANVGVAGYSFLILSQD